MPDAGGERDRRGCLVATCALLASAAIAGLAAYGLARLIEAAL